MGPARTAPRSNAAAQSTAAPGGVPDAATFGRWYDEYLPRVYRFVACRVEERAAAEEITAATFRRAADVSAEEALEPAAAGQFLFRVAATAVVDHARRQRAGTPRGLRASDFDRDTDHRRAAESETADIAARAFTAAIDRAAVRRAIQGLTAAQRRVIVLHYLDELTVDEQCAALGWTSETLTRRLHAALRALHAALSEATGNAA